MSSSIAPAAFISSRTIWMTLCKHAQAERHIGVGAGAKLTDHPRPQKKDMAGSDGVGRSFLERGNQSMRPAHVCKPPGTDRCRSKQLVTSSGVAS